jgi:murein DD-endopeptidase MepM/ murein hydrolase activator NlpD
VSNQSSLNKISQNKISSSDTVYSLLKKYGFTDQQRNMVLAQSSMPQDFVLTPGELYRQTRNAKGDRMELKFFDRDHPRAYVMWRQGKDCGGKLEKLNYDVKLVTAKGNVSGSVIENISQKIGDELVAYRFMDAFLLDYNLPRILQRNAPYSLTVEKLYDQGQFVRFGEVVHAELEILGRNVVREYKTLSRGGVFSAPDINHSTRRFYAPVDYIKISSLFQPRRYHPIKKVTRAHLGVDLELMAGEPVYAVAPGEVIRFGRNHAAGKFIVIRHADNYETYYDHLSEVEVFAVGAHVEPGAVLGHIGCTGYCTRPHLHFAVKHSGTFLNPLNLIRGYAYNQRKEIAQAQ